MTKSSSAEFSHCSRNSWQTPPQTRSESKPEPWPEDFRAPSVSSFYLSSLGPRAAGSVNLGSIEHRGITPKEGSAEAYYFIGETREGQRFYQLNPNTDDFKRYATWGVREIKRLQFDHHSPADHDEALLIAEAYCGIKRAESTSDGTKAFTA